MTQPQDASLIDVLRRSWSVLREDRYAILALSLIALLIVGSFDEGESPTVAVASLYSIIVVTGLYAVRCAPWRNFFGLVLGAMLLASIWIEHATDIAGSARAVIRFADVFFLFLFVRSISVVFAPRDVQASRVSAAICGYMVAAILFASVYKQLYWTDSEAFRGLMAGENGEVPGFSFMYFSFVTQTTLGYGDITPVNPQARALSIVQSTLGVIFIATTIASLVARRDAEQASD